MVSFTPVSLSPGGPILSKGEKTNWSSQECIIKKKNFVLLPKHVFFLADFIAVIQLYSQCQKVSFFPQFEGKSYVNDCIMLKKIAFSLKSISFGSNFFHLAKVLATSNSEPG